MFEPALATSRSSEPPVASAAADPAIGRAARTRRSVPPIVELSWDELMAELRARRAACAVGSLPLVPVDDPVLPESASA